VLLCGDLSPGSGLTTCWLRSRQNGPSGLGICCRYLGGCERDYLPAFVFAEGVNGTDHRQPTVKLRCTVPLRLAEGARTEAKLVPTDDPGLVILGVPGRRDLQARGKVTHSPE
jgi:hypothetical protein